MAPEDQRSLMHFNMRILYALLRTTNEPEPELRPGAPDTHHKGAEGGGGPGLPAVREVGVEARRSRGSGVRSEG